MYWCCTVVFLLLLIVLHCFAVAFTAAVLIIRQYGFRPWRGEGRIDWLCTEVFLCFKSSVQSRGEKREEKGESFARRNHWVQIFFHHHHYKFTTHHIQAFIRLLSSFNHPITGSFQNWTTILTSSVQNWTTTPTKKYRTDYNFSTQIHTEIKLT